MKRFLLLVFFVVFVASALAAVPTVDFNYTPFPNGTQFTDMNFDPIVSTDSNLVRFLWGFPDSNINYFSTTRNSTTNNVLVDDNFNDGDYTNNPVWTVGSGSWSAANNYLETASATSVIYSDKNTFSDTNKSIFYRFWLSGVYDVARVIWNTTATGPSTNGYGLSVTNNSGNGNEVLLRREDGPVTLFQASHATSTNAWHDLNIYHDSNGWIEVKIDGTIVGTANDTTYTDGNRVILHHENAVVGVRFDDFNFTNNRNIINEDKNETHSFSTSGTKTVCLTAENSDGNTTACNDLNVLGTLRINFFDENTYASITPTVTVNGANQILSGNTLNYSLSGTTSNTNFTVLASDANRTQRTWFFQDLNELNGVDVNALLLDINQGRSISFQIFHPNKTDTLNNALIYFVRGSPDLNYAEIKQTDASGNITFFVNEDANYIMDIDANANGNSDFNYAAVKLTVKIPLDESSGVTITPFRIQAGGLASFDLNGLNSNKIVPLFTNTINAYKLKISKPIATDYTFSRTYWYRVFGNPSTDSLQPYLGSDASGTFSSSITVRDFFTRATIPNIVIKAKTSVSGGVLEVESGQTDSTGKILFNFVLGKDYFLDFYTLTQPLTKIGSTQTINAQSTDYPFLLNITTTSFPNVKSVSLDVNYAQDRIVLDANNAFDLNWTIHTKDANFTQIIWKAWTEDGNILVNRTITNDGNVSVFSDGNSFVLNKYDYNRFIVSSLVVTISGTDFNITKTFSVLKTEQNIIESISNSIKQNLGSFGGTLLALIVASFVFSFTTSNSPTMNTNGLFILFAFIVGIFVFIGIVGIINFALALFFSLGAWVYSNKGQ